MKIENRTLVPIYLAPPTHNPVSPPLPPAPPTPARLSLKESGAAETQATQTMEPEMSLQMWADARHTLFGERAKDPTSPLFNATHITYTSFFTIIQTDQPSLRSISQCMLIKSHHYLWSNPSDRSPLALVNFWFSLQLLPATAFADLTTKNPSNLLYLTFIGIIFWELAFISRGGCRYDLLIFASIYFTVELL